MNSVLQLDNMSAAPWGYPLLQDINMELRAGEIHGIIGPNGAGKTSLLRCISGDIAPCAGRLSFCGRELNGWPAQERARCLAVLPQFSLLNFPYTVEEVVLLGRTPHSTGLRTDRQILAEVLAGMDIEHLRQRLYTQLSGGEKQRVQLARIFAQVWRPQADQGRLILLDEPTTALDLGHQLQLMLFLRKLADQGCAIMMVVHDINLLTGIVDQLCALRDGKQMAQGSVAQVISREVFVEVFGVHVEIVPHPQNGRPIVISA